VSENWENHTTKEGRRDKKLRKKEKRLRKDNGEKGNGGAQREENYATPVEDAEKQESPPNRIWLTPGKGVREHRDIFAV